MTFSRRLFDLVFVVPGILVLAPVFAVAALLVKLSDGGPVFFKQERVGYCGRKFRMLKFRTMTVDAPSQGAQITVGGDARITGIGHFLRRWKIDELPQLFNVFRGEMSLVGPRPEVDDFVAIYSDEQRRILDYVPGITDPASLEFRNESDLLATSDDPLRTYAEIVMPEKIRLSLAYAPTATRWSDLGIILRTVFGK